ncbi:MAG TPA: helix-turn-helix domain-containing protein [Candidatus Limnocylindrales bacterium]|nr:helix-turn-helix domain-containing protein [Candidatus Limnocylindrales bacterium]
MSEELGRELRRLRMGKGLSQRELTKRLGLSAHSNIADYENGRRIPPRDIVADCERVLECHTLVPMLDKALAERATAPTTPAVQAVQAVPIAPARWRRHWRIAVVPVILAGAAIGWSATNSTRPAPETPAGPPVKIWDGNDPKAAGCDADAMSLDSQPVGTFGQVLLRYSPACHAAWAKFQPLPSGPAGDVAKAVVVVEAVRPADGIKTSFQYPSLAQIYGDILLTGPGCVRAGATVTLPDGTGATGYTACLQGLQSR